MEVQPTAGRVLIRRQETKNTSKGGIILPDASKKKSQHGTIVAMGGRIRTEHGFSKYEFAEGDKVLFNSYSGTEIDVDGENMVLLEWTEIIAVIKE